MCQALCCVISFNPTDEGTDDQRSPQLCVLQIYSHLCGLLFCIQVQSFDGEKSLLLTQPHLLILPLKISDVCVLFKRSLLPRGYLLHYFVEDLLFYLSYVEMINLELVFVCGIKRGSRAIVFSHTNIHLTHYHYLKLYLHAASLKGYLNQNSGVHICVGLSLDSLCFSSALLFTVPPITHHLNNFHFKYVLTSSGVRLSRKTHFLLHYQYF